MQRTDPDLRLFGQGSSMPLLGEEFEEPRRGVYKAELGGAGLHDHWESQRGYAQLHVV